MSLFFQPHFRLKYYLVGSVVILGIIFLYSTSLSTIWSAGGNYSWEALQQDNYLHRIILFSLGQASLSAFLSLFIGLLFSRAFFYTKFPAKSFILKLLSLTFVLPSLLAVFGLLGVFGISGWLNQLLHFLGIENQIRIYGLQGILIAHLFFNIPLSARMGIQALQSVPPEQYRLAIQLNIRGWHFFRLIELPYLKQHILPTFMLIFLLCFTSFSIVLALGGGPQYSTLEVAVYQAVFFEFDLPKAALFSLIQCLLCCILFIVAQFFTRPLETQLSQQYRYLPSPKSAAKIFHIFVLSIVCLFIFLPLINIVVQGLLAPQLWVIRQNPLFRQALLFSIIIAPTSAFVSLIFGIAILLWVRQLQWLRKHNIVNLILTIGMMILAIPTLVLALGLFLLLQDIDFSTYHLFFIVVCCNALTALPFVIRILNVPMNQNMQYYEKLCLSLNLQGWKRFYYIERTTLNTPLKYAFAIATTISLGDFTAIALFGNQDFTSLPHFLYQQLGQYKSTEAAVTSLILLVLCVTLFLFIEKHKGNDHD
ncbi:thiamine/thiamine pyrophosphate ABC transporter permease ThiP [Rodentibacter caecimuris]|uniref:Thiamine transport system permease protein ThiP n=1 Tax=Rodentibacter caecimuris TaxID=1796644 RepID=A0ABX3KYV3_9PAST|nr:thiamine/thiamine pyrophosphate ABC transporter permease ThiP [Rodentibacter heylii]